VLKHLMNDSDRKGARILLFFTTVVLLVMIYLMIGSWPAATVDLDLNATSTFNHTAPAFNQINDINTTRIFSLPFAHTSFIVGPETLLVTIMMISGAMGACLFSIWAISHHLGLENDFDYIRYRSWYFSRPFLGAGIAFIFYLLVRGGMLTIGTSVMALNVVVIAGLSGLVGMFSEQALLKLLEVAHALFGSSDKTLTPEKEAAEVAEEAKKAAEEAKKVAASADKKLVKAIDNAEKAKQKALSGSADDVKKAQIANMQEAEAHEAVVKTTKHVSKTSAEQAKALEALDKRNSE
jgi:hypothetical protein